jgi:hypothetical protein
MLRLFLSVFLFFAFLFFTTSTLAQSSDDAHVVHVQTNKMTGVLGDDADAFNDMLRRQMGVVNSDSRVVSSRVLRHFWGADSRDFVLVTEFKNLDDLFSFYNDMNSMMEKALSKEQVDKDNEMWAKYVGQHSDEIYQETPGTRK